MQFLLKFALLTLVTVPIVYTMKAALTWVGVPSFVIVLVSLMFVLFFIFMALISINKARSNGDDTW